MDFQWAANEVEMDFQWAANEIMAGRFVQRKHRKGGRILIKSRVQSWNRMGVRDYLATDWEPYKRHCGDNEIIGKVRSLLGNPEGLKEYVGGILRPWSPVVRLYLQEHGFSEP